MCDNILTLKADTLLFLVSIAKVHLHLRPCGVQYSVLLQLHHIHVYQCYKIEVVLSYIYFKTVLLNKNEDCQLN